MGARLGNNFVFSKEFLRRLLGGSSCMKELHLVECLAANLEFWGQTTLGVSRVLITTLSISYMLLQLAV